VVLSYVSLSDYFLLSISPIHHPITPPSLCTKKRRANCGASWATWPTT
jgi:hypothetical protein